MIKINKYIRLNEDGSTQLVTENVEDRSITNDLCNMLAANTILTACRVGSLSLPDFAPPDGLPKLWYGVALTKKEQFVFTPLTHITLRCRFVLGPDKILRPKFTDTKTPSEDPEMSINWVPPFRLLFMSRVQNCMIQPDQSSYLFAVDDQSRFWRLPLPNIFEDCAICMGAYDYASDDSGQALTKALQQFYKSGWNADLLGNDILRRSNADKMFRFMPQDDGFKQLEIEGDWTALCEKIATPVTTIASSIISSYE